MELYESNYIRFRRLCPDLASIEHDAFSRVHGALDLHLKVRERSRHTSTISLTYYLDDNRGIQRANPDFKLRIYHDALQVQALSYFCISRSGAVRAHLATSRTTLAHGWTMNRFLFKWLGYCLDQGHVLSCDRRDRLREIATSPRATTE